CPAIVRTSTRLRLRFIHSAPARACVSPIHSASTARSSRASPAATAFRPRTRRRSPARTGPTATCSPCRAPTPSSRLLGEAIPLVLADPFDPLELKKRLVVDLAVRAAADLAQVAAHQLVVKAERLVRADEVAGERVHTAGVRQLFAERRAFEEVEVPK